MFLEPRHGYRCAHECRIVRVALRPTEAPEAEAVQGNPQVAVPHFEGAILDTSLSLSLCFALLLWRRLHGISQQQEKKGSVTPDRRKTPHMKKSNCVRIVFSSIVVVLMDTMWKIGSECNENCSKKRGENVAVMSPSAL